MEQQDINTYRLTGTTEPTDDMLSQIMHEAAQEAKAKNEESTQRFFDKIKKAVAML